MKNLGARLKEERKSMGLSQQQFAQMGGVEANAQGKYESGARAPRSDYLVALGFKGVDVLYLLSGARMPVSLDTLDDAEKAMLLNYRVLTKPDQSAIGQLTWSLAGCLPHSRLEG
ncbi:transcriptional regulator with XRE-family HTH domain [Pseudomonas sp. JUb42]|jgi:transcriptional regulator with XRE-family HTH domain|uniref:helix-turn-helix domain-containing protein n=1 Tax=Pseudomonas sp. JUb42 TaxID=2940611 RepID=UPI002168CA1C|nr:helix-turn-helix domain-containing protein [Pseudomonas sp. JUb42]MCS3470828.1 transcriptional regulator with XRE-family HTH domain [Pseudomonas sp. JUb42]